jgi:ferrochelatase
MTKQAVLVLAYGTPNSVERMRCYLSDIRGGRPMSDEFVAEFQHRYALIDGSPLTALTYDQARHTGAELTRQGHDDAPLVALDKRRHRTDGSARN